MSTRLTTFDGTETLTCEVRRPDRYRELFSLLSSSPKFVARGAGLSYSGASLSHDGIVVKSECFNRLLEFDPVAGALTLESGVRLGDLLDFSLPRGWYPPVLPGHPSISVGGCVAFNVHGKSQFAQGCFEDCIERLWLFHPAHGEIECAKRSSLNPVNEEIFNLTVGGMGLTGYITKVKLKLTPLPGASIERTRVPVVNLLEAAETMEKLHQEFPILYSWNDLNLRGDKFGRGVVYAERFTTQVTEDRDLSFNTLRPPDSRSRPLPLLNNLTAPLMCALYGWNERRAETSETMTARKATFPINGKEFYFGLFGRRGFREYQMIIPTKNWPEAYEKIRTVIKESSCGISLGSLKLFKGQGRYLNFNGDGICLSIDVPATPKSLKLFDKLDAVVLAASGVVNLSKDNRITADFARKVFPEYSKFSDELKKFDSKSICTSSLRSRLGIA